MKKITITIALVLIIIGYRFYYPSFNLHYRMTVEVDTPEGVKSGSSVRELSNFVIPILSHYRLFNSADIKGEAVVVDLGKRGLLFVLISDESDDEFYQVFPIEGAATAQGIRYYRNLDVGLKRTLEEGEYFPQFVTFNNITNPKTIQQVDHNDLAETFGEGVKFKGITIETTSEPVTWQIENYLTWLPKYKEYKYYLGGDDITPFNDPSKTFVALPNLRTGNNSHQILNCRSNLFVKDAEHSRVVHSAFIESAKNRPKSRHKINYAVRDNSDG